MVHNKCYISLLFAAVLTCRLMAGGNPAAAAETESITADMHETAAQAEEIVSTASQETAAQAEETVSTASQAQTESESPGIVTTGGSPWLDTDLKANITEDMELSPKDDFYLYANHDWLLNTVIQDGQWSAASFMEAGDEVTRRTIELLEDDSLTGHDAFLVQHLYRSYLDWDARNEAGTDPLMERVRDIQGIGSMEELSEYLCDFDRSGIADIFFSLDLDTSMEDSRQLIPFVIMHDLTLSDAEEYIQRTDYGDTCYSAYLYAAKALLTRIGYSEDEVQTMFDAMIGLEGKLAATRFTFAQMMSSDYRSMINNLYTMDEMEGLCERFPLTDYIISHGFGEADIYDIMEPEAVKGIDALYVPENLEAIKDALIITCAVNMMEFLDAEAYDVYWTYNNMLYGTQGRKEDRVSAMDFVRDKMFSETAKVYVENGDYAGLKSEITEICEDAVAAYREMLKGEDWLSEDTREKAIEKLDALRIRAVYPDKWRDYSSLKLDGLSLTDCIDAIARFENEYNISLINHMIDPDIWYYDPLDTNAMYDDSNNSIYIFLGYIVEPFYHEGMQRAELLGGIGCIIGHEISHAFDTGGAQVDKDGNMKNWWTDEDYEAFWSRTEKMIDYYNGITVWEGTNVIGENIVSEAIADISGVKVMLEIAKEEENFDYEKFFKSYAASCRRLNTWEKENSSLYQDVHPLHYLRTNVTVQQFDEFLETFDVQETDNMYLAPGDRISVW